MPRHPLSATVRFKKLHDDVQLPKRQSEAAGFDLHAYLPKGKVGIPPGERKIVNTGFAMQIDPGYAVHVQVPWMAVALVETVDPGDGEQEVKILIRNLAPTTLILEPNALIAHLMVVAIARLSILEDE